MLLIAGTLPIAGLKLKFGTVRAKEKKILIDGEELPLERGTASAIASLYITSKELGKKDVLAAISGDTGKGEGSEELYKFLEEKIPELSPDVVCFSYIMPIKDLHNKVLSAIKGMKEKPKLIADAGYMYVAKMSGNSKSYDIFTPDLGELAFLADEKSPHPFYTRGFIFHGVEKPEDLIKRAYETGGASRVLCVKGERDYICKDGKIVKVIEEPNVPELEPIGGTGDTITGMIAAFLGAGYNLEDAAVFSSRVNRIAGLLSKPTPASSISEIIKKIPEALQKL